MQSRALFGEESPGSRHVRAAQMMAPVTIIYCTISVSFYQAGTAAYGNRSRNLPAWHGGSRNVLECSPAPPGTQPGSGGSPGGSGAGRGSAGPGTCPGHPNVSLGIPACPAARMGSAKARELPSPWQRSPTRGDSSTEPWLTCHHSMSSFRVSPSRSNPTSPGSSGHREASATQGGFSMDTRGVSCRVMEGHEQSSEGLGQ